jgi:2'-5' RNA ligase
VAEETLRLFVAVNPDERFKHRLTTQLDAWREQLRIAWVRPHAWHTTLDFLGDWPRARVPELVAALRDAVAPLGPFAATAGEVGGFPSLARPRVLVLHLESGGRLEELARTVRTRVDALWPGGPQDRKPFRAHLTLARIKAPLASHQRALLGRIVFVPWDPFPVTQVHLVRSELGRGGARHSDLTRAPLAGPTQRA